MPEDLAHRKLSAALEGLPDVAAPGIYFETDHYRGWPAVLVRIKEIELEELHHRLRKAWLTQAPKRLAKQFLAAEGR